MKEHNSANSLLMINTQGLTTMSPRMGYFFYKNHERDTPNARLTSLVGDILQDSVSEHTDITDSG